MHHHHQPTAGRSTRRSASRITAGAAVGVALLVAGCSDGDDDTAAADSVADVGIDATEPAPTDPAPTDPAPTDPPTTSAPAPTDPPATSAPIEPAPEDLEVVDAYIATSNAGDVEGVLALFASDVGVTESYRSPPNPAAERFTASDLENKLAWNLAQGQQLGEPGCVIAPDQPDTGVRLLCRYATSDAIVLALDAEPTPTTSLITVADGIITELHQGYGSPSPASYGVPFDAWMEREHPDVEGADCCAGDTRAESETRGALRAEWAAEYARSRDG